MTTVQIKRYDERWYNYPYHIYIDGGFAGIRSFLWSAKRFAAKEVQRRQRVRTTMHTVVEYETLGGKQHG